MWRVNHKCLDQWGFTVGGATHITAEIQTNQPSKNQSRIHMEEKVNETLFLIEMSSKRLTFNWINLRLSLYLACRLIWTHNAAETWLFVRMMSIYLSLCVFDRSRALLTLQGLMIGYVSPAVNFQNCDWRLFSLRDRSLFNRHCGFNFVLYVRLTM